MGSFAAAGALSGSTKSLLGLEKGNFASGVFSSGASGVFVASGAAAGRLKGLEADAAEGRLKGSGWKDAGRLKGEPCEP